MADDTISGIVVVTFSTSLVDSDTYSSTSIVSTTGSVGFSKLSFN